MIKCQNCNEKTIKPTRKLAMIFDGETYICPSCNAELKSYRFLGFIIGSLSLFLAFFLFPLSMSNFGFIVGVISMPLVFLVNSIILGICIPLRVITK